MPISQQQQEKMMMVAHMKEQMLMVNSITENCFSDCVLSFRSKALEDSEELCVSRCVDKYYHLVRVTSEVFANEQAKLQNPGL